MTAPLLALLAILLTTTPLTVGEIETRQVLPPHDKAAALTNLKDFACTVLYWDCSAIPLPRVEYRQLDYIGSGVAGAFYGGTDVIYLDTDYFNPKNGVDQIQLMSVIVHELTHYLDDQLNDLTRARTKALQCHAEAKAWHVGNSFLVWVGLPDRVDYQWHNRYGCESPSPVTGIY